MAFAVRRSNYYYVTVKDEPGEGHRLLADLAGLGVNLLAFTAVPTGPTRTQFALFPANEAQACSLAARLSKPTMYHSSSFRPPIELSQYPTLVTLCFSKRSIVWSRKRANRAGILPDSAV